jgi:hypothetical protein
LLLHVAVVPDTHRPVGMRASVTQHVLDRRSHGTPVAQSELLKVLQSAPVHSPLAHTRPPHAAPLSCHIPVALQFCGCWPLHCVWFGAHWPWHIEPMPIPTHVWLVQLTAVAQLPAGPQDCCADVPAHSTCVGAQTPWH